MVGIYNFLLVSIRGEHDPGRGSFGRRDFLKFGGLVFLDMLALEAMFVVGKPYLIQAWDWLQQQRHRLDVIWAREVPCNANTHTIYSLSQLQRTYTIASGDSIGEGYYAKGKPKTPAAEYATQAVNDSTALSESIRIHPTWDNYTVAKEGSRIPDVVAQLADPHVQEVLDREENVDWWLSVGGNDIVHELARKAARIKKVADNPFTTDFFTIDDEMLAAIARYQVGFLKLIRQVASRNDRGNIRRLIIEGLPNLGNADRIDYVSRDGTVVESYPLNQERLGKFFATNLSILVNNAMKESINQLLTEHPGMDILFLDTFHMLPGNDLLGEHPLPWGQRTMAAGFFDMAYHAGINLGRLLFPSFVRAAAADVRRSREESSWVIQIPTLV